MRGLSYFDGYDAGFLESHEVGIWNASTGDLLADTTVPGGTAAPWSDFYRYASIPTLTLTPGYYDVAGYTTSYGDAWGYGNYSNFAGLTPGPNVSGLVGIYTYSGSFTLPTAYYWQFYGAGNFLEGSGATSTPAPGALCSFAAGGLMMLRKRKSRA